MLKKIFCGILVSALLTVMTSGFAATPTVTVDKLTLNVTTEYTNPPKKAAIQVLDLAKTKVWYNGVGEVVNGKVVFDTFSLPKNIPTGTYIVRCTPDDEIPCETTVSIANTYEQINAYNSLAKADVSQYSTMIGDGILFGVDAAEYQKLDDTTHGAIICGMVNDYLKKTDWYVGENGEYLDEKKTLFETAFATAMEAAYLLLAEDNAKITKLNHLTPDVSEYYKLLSKDGYLARMKVVAKGVTEIEADSIYQAFDEAVLLASIDELDYTTVDMALAYYEEKGIVSLNRSVYDDLKPTVQAQAIIQLKDYPLNDCSEIPAAFLEICKELYEEESDTPGTGFGGGGGGGVSVGITNSVPGSAVADVGESASADNVNGGETEPAAVFSDMADYAWAQEAVTTLYQKGIIAGKGGGKFAPADNITREEFVKLMVVLLNLPDAQGADFRDVSADDWCYHYIASATASGIINGVGDGKFGKGRTITREDMVVILHRAAEYAKINLGAEKSIRFTDDDAISSYAKRAVNVLANAGIINGVGENTFAPKAPVTRAEAAKAVYEIDSKMEVER